jgi:pyruvate formate lyase activating enzyme
MQIRDFLKESINNYPGKIASVVFSPGCNYKCPACHAKHLLENGENKKEEDFFEYLDFMKDKNWIEAVVLCGGEPTLQPDLKFFAEKLKRRDLAVKLDTNGSNPSVLQELKEEKLVDYVAMDVKGPKSLYPNIIGRDYIDFRDHLEKSIAITANFPDYEFRTTVVPVVRDNEEISFMTVEEIVETAKLIYDYTWSPYDCTGTDLHKYFLQPFVPKKGELVDSRLEDFPETPKKLLEEMKEAVIKKYLPNCEVR